MYLGVLGSKLSLPLVAIYKHPQSEEVCLAKLLKRAKICIISLVRVRKLISEYSKSGFAN